MNIDFALKVLNNNEILWDIGQLNEETKRKLNMMARKGIIVKERAMWPWYAYGVTRKTCYIARKEEKK